MKKKFQTLKTDIPFFSMPLYHGFPFPFPFPYFKSKQNQRVQNKKLQEFLEKIQWKKRKFSSNELKAILVKNGLWYLKGLITLDFLLELNEEVRCIYATNMKYELKEITGMLHFLYEKIQRNEISLEAKEVIHKIVNESQKVITGRDGFDILHSNHVCSAS